MGRLRTLCLHLPVWPGRGITRKLAIASRSCLASYNSSSSWIQQWKFAHVWCWTVACCSCTNSIVMVRATWQQQPTQHGFNSKFGRIVCVSGLLGAYALRLYFGRARGFVGLMWPLIIYDCWCHLKLVALECHWRPGCHWRLECDSQGRHCVAKAVHMPMLGRLGW